MVISCSSCVCCCYNGTSGFVDMQPASDCTCKNNIKSSDVKIGVTLAVIVLVPTLLASSYFSGVLGISPYKKIRYKPKLKTSQNLGILLPLALLDIENV